MTSETKVLKAAVRKPEDSSNPKNSDKLRMMLKIDL